MRRGLGELFRSFLSLLSFATISPALFFSSSSSSVAPSLRSPPNPNPSSASFQGNGADERFFFCFYSVTECTGGSMELSEGELPLRYQSFCDPRLNFEQSLGEFSSSLLILVWLDWSFFDLHSLAAVYHCFLAVLPSLTSPSSRSLRTLPSFPTNSAPLNTG
jgi:Class-II DAHP synthetase family